jgi:hypothetical protein
MITEMNLIRLTQAFLPLFFLFFSIETTFAQDEKEEPEFFTGISPVILKRNTTEISLLNSLYSFWWSIKEYNTSALPTGFVDRARFTRLDQLLRLTYGFSKNKNWDLSAELRFSHARLDDDARSSPLKVLEKTTGLKSGDLFQRNQSYHGLSFIGVRLRGTPFKSIPELTVQGTFHKYVAPSPDKREAFSAARNMAGFTATYFLQSGENVYYFFQTDWNTALKSNEVLFTGHQLSLSTTLVFKTWAEGLFIYPGMSYGSNYSSSFFRLSQQFFINAGAFYQPTTKFSIFLNWQLPILFESGSQYVEFVKGSFTGVTLGVRTLL